MILKPYSTLLDSHSKKILGSPPIYSNTPLSFESINQYSGFVLYETVLPSYSRDPLALTVERLRDRALVFVDRNYVGILSRANKVDTLSISVTYGKKLQILVENEGRINYGITNDFKGILGNVQYGPRALNNWTITGFPLEDYSLLESVISKASSKYASHSFRASSRSFVKTGPTIFHAEFNLKEDQIADTYLDPTGWGKVSDTLVVGKF